MLIKTYASSVFGINAETIGINANVKKRVSFILGGLHGRVNWRSHFATSNFQW